MDNITHSLVGAYIGVATSGRYALTGKARAAVVCASIFANSLPDLDLLYLQIIPGPLGYLLHHRGHTHTLLFTLAPLIALVLALLVFKLFTHRSISKPLCSSLLIVTALGSIVHVGLDALNSYGVHPFWPFLNSWFYGDTLFIIEPILWLIFSITLYFQTNKLLLKIVLSLIAFVASGLLLFSGYLPLLLALAIILSSSVVFLIFKKITETNAIKTGCALALVILLVFASASVAVKSKLRSIHFELYSSATLHEVITSPNPANPTCWSFIFVTTKNGEYELRRGVYSLLGSVGRNCSALFTIGDLAPQVVNEPSNDHLHWLGMFSTPLEDLRSLANQSCEVRAFLQFARAPVFRRTAKGVVISDLRFDRNKDRVPRFAHLEVANLENDQKLCPRWLPPWTAPRADMLGG